jgi:hypothetical protein
LRDLDKDRAFAFARAAFDQKAVFVVGHRNKRTARTPTLRCTTGTRSNTRHTASELSLTVVWLVTWPDKTLKEAVVFRHGLSPKMLS